MGGVGGSGVDWLVASIQEQSHNPFLLNMLPPLPRNTATQHLGKNKIRKINFYITGVLCSDLSCLN